MAEQEKRDLGRRAVACKHWRWLPGMLMRSIQRTRGDQSRKVYESADRLDGCSSLYKESDILANEGRYYDEPDEEVIDRWPDLGDAATRGCIAFELLPAAWGPESDVSVSSDGSVMVDVPGHDNQVGPCRVGTAYPDVVAALEAAP